MVVPQTACYVSSTPLNTQSLEIPPKPTNPTVAFATAASPPEGERKQSLTEAELHEEGLEEDEEEEEEGNSVAY